MIVPDPYECPSGSLIFRRTLAARRRVSNSLRGVCSTASRRNGCSLTGPPPAIDLDGGHSQVTVAEEAGGAFTVTLRVRGAIQPGQPAFLRVDGNPAHRAAPDRLGSAGWSGPEAAKIIDELKAGTGMVVRSFAAGSGAARDEFLSLGGFGDALTAYRDNRRTFGILRRK